MGIGIGFMPNPEQIEKDLQEILKDPGYISGNGELSFPVTILSAILLVALVLILSYLVFRIANRSFLPIEKPVFDKKKKELIEKQDYSIFYKEALDLGKKEQYLHGVRMLYMGLLVLLDSKQIIGYHPSLTNLEYRQIVQKYHFSALFNSITRTFDTLYYGGRKATARDFSHCIDTFTKIMEAVS
jgi:hypothetical protein